MPGGGSKPGQRRGGRKKGVPNKVTTVARQAFLATFGRLEGDLEKWIRETADGVPATVTAKDGSVCEIRQGADPGKAADLIVRMAEYHVPKLGRQELVGGDGGPLQIIIQKYGEGE